MRLGTKYDRFMRHRASGEFLEGTTAAGKTTVGALKFMMQVARSPHSQHILSGLDLGTIEKNIIAKPHGILDELGDLVEYRGGGSSGNALPHILMRYGGAVKTIYVLGYADKARWKKALGGQYGCLFIDEANIADMDFVREAVMRCDYFMATLNPDDPDLPIYTEYIDKAVPMCPEDTPEPILAKLTGEVPSWSHWFFTFEDNISLTPEKIATIKANVPEGTKLWKNKVLGLRGKAEGLVFPTYDPARHDISEAECGRLLETHPDWRRGDERFAAFTSGLDTSYSSQSADSIAMTFGGITDRGRYILLECREYNNRGRGVPLAPTDTVRLYTGFLEECRRWGLARHCFVDSADQATITELRKWKRSHPECLHIFENSHKKLSNIDRIELQLGWMGRSDPAFRINAGGCQPYIRELGAYSWDGGRPEDANDHCIQSCQYSWIPYRDRIGR